MKAKLSQAFLIFSILFLLATIGWLIYPSPYRVCHFILTGMGRARLYPYTAKFKPYKGKTMGGSAIMNTIVKEQIASFTDKNEPYCFLSLGAELSGTAEAFFTKGEAVTKAFNAMNLDAMLLGNIEYTFGKNRITQLAKTTNFKFLASNVIEESTGNAPEGFIQEYIINAPYDLKVGVLGLSPVDTPTLTPKENVSGLRFLQPAEVLKTRVESLRNQGADLVALLTQYDKEYITPEEWLCIASASPDICIMLDSDIATPQPVTKDGVVIYSISNYNQTKEIDILNLQITKKKPVEIVGLSSERLAVNLAEYDEDSEMQKVVDEATEAIRARRDTFVGNFAKDYSKAFYSECPIGNFIADTLLKATGADIAFQNSGGIHNNVSEGKFTLGDLYRIMPFDNKIVTMDLKGSSIIELLKVSASRQRGILQVAGLEYSYSFRNNKDFALNSVKINGKDVVLDKTYKVATNNFLAEGGDNYLAFTKGENIVVGDSQRDTVREYIASMSVLAPIELKTYGRIIVEE